MSTVKVKLTQSHEYKRTEYPKGTILTVTPEVANSLISRGIAEKYFEAEVSLEPKADEEVAVAANRKGK